MKIKEVAKLTGVTVRTLHYYDQIGLLKPSTVTEAGYRLYEEEDLFTLQQILIFRELSFPLEEIREIMTNPNYNKQEALARHKELLIKKRERLDNLIHLVDNVMKGESLMSFNEFDSSEIEKAKKEYANEVKTKWGHTDAYKESEDKTKSYDNAKWELINKECVAIFREFARIKDQAPDSEEAQKLVKKWQDCITSNFYTCTKEILAGLGQMYVADERFTKSIDQYGEGTAAFMNEAIQAYCR